MTKGFGVPCRKYVAQNINVWIRYNFLMRHAIQRCNIILNPSAVDWELLRLSQVWNINLRKIEFSAAWNDVVCASTVLSIGEPASIEQETLQYKHECSSYHFDQFNLQTNLCYWHEMQCTRENAVPCCIHYDFKFSSNDGWSIAARIGLYVLASNTLVALVREENSKKIFCTLLSASTDKPILHISPITISII